MIRASSEAPAEKKGTVLDAHLDPHRRHDGLAGERADVDHHVEDAEGPGPVRLVGRLAHRPGDHRFDDGPAQHDQRQAHTDRSHGVEDAQGAVTHGQQREGHHQGGAESDAVGQGPGEERHQIDPAAEHAGHPAGLHVVQADDADQVGAQGDEGPVVGGAFAQFGGVAGPEHAGKAPGLDVLAHVFSPETE